MREVIDPRHALDALLSIDPGCIREEWHAIGRAAIAAGLTVEDIIGWSRTADNFSSERDVRAAFRGITANGRTGPGTLWQAALRTGWRPPRGSEEAPRREPRPVVREVQAAEPAQHAVLSPFWRSRWNEGQALRDNIGSSYLQARQCVIPPADGHLRFHPAIKHWPSGLVAPAVLALGTDAVTGEPITMHITFVQADGTKSNLSPARLLAPGHRKKGAVIRLWPDEAVTLGLGIAEGIETALSLAHAFTPVWSCIDAGNLAAFQVLDGIESLLIAADNDDAGRAASEACAERWDAAGCESFIVMPDAHKTDLNDLARAA